MTKPSDELKQRGIEFLLSQRNEERQPGEMSAKDLAVELDFDPATVYNFMQKFVQDGTWKTRMAYDVNLHRNIRVWWMNEENKK